LITDRQKPVSTTFASPKALFFQDAVQQLILVLAPAVTWARWDVTKPHSREINVLQFNNTTGVPSKLAYGKNESVFWGSGVQSAVPGYSWTKVMLDGQQGHRSYRTGLLSRLVGNGYLRLHSAHKHPKVVADFLRELRKHIERELFGDSAESQLPVEFWFTVPSSWSEKGRQAMLDAVEAAGFTRRALDRVFLLREGEAAALSVFDQLPQLRVRPPPLLRSISWSPANPGPLPVERRNYKFFLVCDCGGATTVSSRIQVTRFSIG
jgi:hypothetical protein